ncbi:MAG: F0F1 ATP synthase subunit epsilon [Tannerella sp.]|jgi:F-type H+-transporting ATPase subunit epsilon|nr:F0F1 ATP synthase subunit epsilon [Tannerella sp.]
MLTVKILSPAGTVFDGNVTHVTFPGGAGSFSVYPLHAPILSTLTGGNIICYVPDSERKTIPVQSGFVEVKNGQITVCIE